MPIFVITFIAAQMIAAAALSSRVEVLAIIRFRTFLASILSATYREIVAMRIDRVCDTPRLTS